MSEQAKNPEEAVAKKSLKEQAVDSVKKEVKSELDWQKSKLKSEARYQGRRLFRDLLSKIFG